MLGSPSSEFIALCQSQVLLLTQALGAASTVVYLAETTAEALNPALIPLVAYPETADLWHGLRAGLRAGADVVGESGADPSAIVYSERWLRQSTEASPAPPLRPPHYRPTSEKKCRV